MKNTAKEANNKEEASQKKSANFRFYWKTKDKPQIA